MNNKTKRLLVWVGVAGVIVVLLTTAFLYNNRPGDLDPLAQCIDDSGATFYGAFWCGACKSQKEMFGQSSRLLPYVECSTADGNSTTIACRNANVTSYPTWEFSDGTRQVGVIALEDLAAKTGCEEAL